MCGSVLKLVFTVHKRKISILITNGETIVGELSLNGSDITRYYLSHANITVKLTSLI